MLLKTNIILRQSLRPWWLPMILALLFCTSTRGQLPAKDESQAAARNRMLHYIAAGDSALNQELAKEALSHFLLALKDAESNGWGDYILGLNIKLGQSYNKISRYDEALLYLKQAETHPLLPEMLEEQAKVFSLIGAVYESLGSYTQAYEYQLKALESRENISDSLGIAESLYKIGSLFYYQKKYDKALMHYQDALAICEKNEAIPPKYLFNCLSALGSVYEEMNLQKESLDYNTRSLELAQRHGNEKNKAYALLNIGENHTNLGNFTKAKECLTESLRLSQVLGISRAEILSYQRLGELFLHQHQPEEAVSVLYQGYFLCKETGSKTLLVNILDLLAQAHEAADNYGAANNYLREYAVLKDSLLNETTVKELSTLSTLYELEKKETAISLLQKERELFEARKQADRLTTTVLIGSSFILLVLSGWLFYWMMAQRRSNQVLKHLNAQIESQNLQLQSYNEELRQYAYVASHDLQEPLRTIGSFVTIIKRKYTDQLDEQAQQYMGFVTEGVARLQRLMRDLLAYTRIEREKTDFELLESKEIVRFVLSGLNQVIEESFARIIVDEDSMPLVNGNRARLTQVFQNLISNAVKFRGEAAPIIEVGCLPSSNQMEFLFYVKDNGIGIPEDFREKMFEMFTRLHSREEYEGSGIGLATCRKIIENHSGRIWAESDPGMGSAVFFTLPVPHVKEIRERTRISRAASMLP